MLVFQPQVVVSFWLKCFVAIRLLLGKNSASEDMATVKVPTCGRSVAQCRLGQCIAQVKQLNS